MAKFIAINSESGRGTRNIHGPRGSLISSMGPGYMRLEFSGRQAAVCSLKCLRMGEYRANSNKAEARSRTVQSASRESRCHRNSGTRGLIIGIIPQYARGICVKRIYGHNAATNGDLVAVSRVSYRGA